MECSRVAAYTALILGLVGCGGGGSDEPSTPTPLKVQVINYCGEVETVPTTFIFHSGDGGVLGTAQSDNGVAPESFPEGTRHLTLLQRRGSAPDAMPMLQTFVNWDREGLSTLTLERGDLKGKCNCRTISVDANDLNTQLGDYRLNIGGNDLSWTKVTKVETCKHQGQWDPLSIVARPNVPGTTPYGAYYPITDATPESVALPIDLMDNPGNQATELEVEWSGIQGSGVSYFQSYRDTYGYMIRNLPIHHDEGETAFYLPRMGEQAMYRAEYIQDIAKGVTYSLGIATLIKNGTVKIDLNSNAARFVEIAKSLAISAAETGTHTHYDLTQMGNNGSELLLAEFADNFAPLWTISAPLQGTIPDFKLPDGLMEKVIVHQGKLFLVGISGTNKTMALNDYRRFVQNALNETAGTTTTALPNHHTEGLSIWID